MSSVAFSLSTGFPGRVELPGACPHFSVPSVESAVLFQRDLMQQSCRTTFCLWPVPHPSAPYSCKSCRRHLLLRERSDIRSRGNDSPCLARGRNKYRDSSALLQFLLWPQCWAVEEGGPSLLCVRYPLSATALVLRQSSGVAWVLAVSTVCWWGRKEFLPSLATTLGG